MFPLLFLVAVGLVGLASYQFSSKTHEWVDEHVAAVRAALGAHEAADAHLGEAQARVDEAQQIMSTADANVHQAPAQNQPAPTPQQIMATANANVHQALAQNPPASTPPAGHAARDAIVHDLLSSASSSLQNSAAANMQAGGATMAAAQTAKTPQQKVAVVNSATVVTNRQQQIDAEHQRILAMIAALGQGKCGEKIYKNVTAQKRDALLARLHAAGMIVTGNNPWDIDTNQANVKLRAALDPSTGTLHVIVVAPVDPKLYPALCGMIWSRVDPIMKEVLGA